MDSGGLPTLLSPFRDVFYVKLKSLSALVATSRSKIGALENKVVSTLEKTNVSSFIPYSALECQYA